jgi:serine/threonine protein kinase
MIPLPTGTPLPALDEYVQGAAAMADELLAPEGYAGSQLIASSERGDIYQAKDQTGHVVAIRLIDDVRFSEAEAEAFVREARAGVRLHHPHIVRTITTGHRQGQRYLVMEMVDGRSLRHRITSQGALSEREAVVLLAQMAQALGYAWRHGVAHRDVRPANVLLAPSRPGEREPFCSKLANFGLSRLRQPDESRRFTRSGKTVRPTAAGPGEDMRGLAMTVCWALTPGAVTEDEDALPDPGPSTLRVDGVSPEIMQLLGVMLAAGQPGAPGDASVTWHEIIERARHLPQGGLTSPSH